MLAIAGACASPHTAPVPLPPGVPVVTERALRIYRDAVVIDTHNDMPTKMLDDAYDADIRHPPGFAPGQGNTDLPRLIESGMTAEFLSAWVDAPYAHRHGDSFARALRYVETIRAFASRHPDALRFATTAAEVRAAKQNHRVAILIGVEGGHAIEASLDNLRELYARGARYMTLTWNNGNPWAGSSIGVDGTRKTGLSPFGRSVIHEMNRLGMLVDISHVSDSTFYDVLATSAAPVIASHSSARAINDVPRNLSDDQLRAIARNGGVVNINFYSRFVDPVYRARAEEVDRAVARERRTLAPRGDSSATRARMAALRDSLLAAIPPTPFATLIEHFVHVARVAGVDHVGIGSDFDGVTALPSGMEDVTALPRIAQALLDGGYTDADVTKMLGGNMLRVMTRVLDRPPVVP